MKNKIPKTIFILLFIPYIYILSSTLFGKYILNDVELKGIERLMKNIVSNYQYYVYEIPIIPTCLTFQICYLFRKKPKIMFICSFIPCIFILLLGIQYAIWGGRFLGDTLYYGLEGFNLGIFFWIYLLYFKATINTSMFNLPNYMWNCKNKEKTKQCKQRLNGFLLFDFSIYIMLYYISKL